MSGLDLAWAFVLRWPRECTEGVTRRDEFQPCDLPAVAVRIDPEEGQPYPVCKRHVRGDMVPLPDLIAAVRAQVARDVEASCGMAVAGLAVCDQHLASAGIARATP